MKKRSRLPGICCRALIVGAFAMAPVSAAQMRLLDLIDAVRASGHGILYSSDLVYGAMRVEVDEASLASLRQALPALGLQLEANGDVWLIRRGPRPADPEPTAPPAAPAPAQVASDRPQPESIIVTGSRHRFPQLGGASSGSRYTVRDMTDVPSLASDPTRALLRVPGVSSVGISAKPHVRGGLKDELLILQDGVELVEPFHLADYHSPYSTLDYHTVETVDFYTGGFPSRYGNRMSGVMDINNQWRDRRYRTNVGVSSFASFINTQLPLPRTDAGSLALSYRQGDLSRLTDYVETRAGNPRYRDASLRFQAPLRGTTQLKAGLAFSEDDITFDDIGEFASSQIDHGYGWLTLDLQPNERFQSRLSLSAVDFSREKRLVNAEIEDDPEDPGSFLDYDQDLRRIGVRHDNVWQRGSVIHEFGWQLEYAQAAYRNSSRIDRGDLADIIGTQRLVERNISLSPEGWSGGAYWAGEWALGKRWLVQPGLRWDWQDYYLRAGTAYQITPRLGVAFDVSPALRLRVSAGRFYQPEGIHELQVLDGIERFYRPQRSDQVVAGLEWSSSRWQLVVESYYKDYKNPKGRFENVFNPFVLLPEMESDRLGLLPEGAIARGVDVDLRHTIRPSLSARLRYSYMKAEDALEGRWVDRRWSQAHTVNASLLWQEDDFSVAVALLWHSGWRSTRPPEFIAEDDGRDVLDFLNNTQLRDHFSIDVSARYRWTLPRAQLEVYADISNLTDRANVAGIDFDEDEVDGGFLLTPDRETLLGLIPSIGITLSF